VYGCVICTRFFYAVQYVTTIFYTVHTYGQSSAVTAEENTLASPDSFHAV